MKRDGKRKQEILEAAERLFLERGFQATSTVMIAREVGCNQAMVHYYFSSKDQLFEAIFEKKMRLFATGLLEIGSEDIPFQEKLKRRIEAHFDMISQNPRLPILLMNELNFNPQRIQALKAKVQPLPQMAIAQLQQELDKEVAAGRIRPMPIMDLLITMISLNVMLFMAEPMFRTILGLPDDVYAEFIARRKAANVELILKSLQP